MNNESDFFDPSIIVQISNTIHKRYFIACWINLKQKDQTFIFRLSKNMFYECYAESGMGSMQFLG